jgi:nucleoside-diphosphate-sugar epimerase
MNIIIVGGGSKFGKFVSNKLISMGHNVYILSHQNYDTDNQKHLHANFLNVPNVKEQFNKIVDKLDSIDIFLCIKL